MKKINLFLISALIWGAIVSISYAQVVEEVVAPIDIPGFVEIQNVSVERPVYNQGDTIKGKFTMFNNSRVDFPLVTYRISLITDYVNGVGTSLLDQSDLSDYIYIGSGASKDIDFSFDIPNGVAGQKVGVEISAVTKSGEEMGWSETFIEILGEHRFVYVYNLLVSVNDKNFGSQDGATFYDGDNIKLTASLQNSIAESRILIPEISISAWGKEDVQKMQQIKLDKIVLPGNAKESYEFKLPANLQSGVYVGEVIFYDENGARQSAPVSFRYIKGGNIATIHNVTIDKTEIRKNEQINVGVEWTGTPFDITNQIQSNLEDLDIFIQLINERGKAFAEYKGKLDTTKDIFNTNLTAMESAKAISALVEISKNGGLLSSYKTKLNENFDEISNLQKKQISNMRIIFLSLGALILVLIILWVTKSSKKTLNVTSVLLALFIISGLFYSISITDKLNAYTILESQKQRLDGCKPGDTKFDKNDSIDGNITRREQCKNLMDRTDLLPYNIIIGNPSINDKPNIGEDIWFTGSFSARACSNREKMLEIKASLNTLPDNWSQVGVKDFALFDNTAVKDKPSTHKTITLKNVFSLNIGKVSEKGQHNIYSRLIHRVLTPNGETPLVQGVVIIKHPFEVGDQFGVSCRVSPSSTKINSKVEWKANAFGGDGNYNYEWSNGSNTLSETGSRIIKSYNSAGTYSMWVKASDGSGNTTSDWIKCSNSLTVSAEECIGPECDILPPIIDGDDTGDGYDADDPGASPFVEIVSFRSSGVINKGTRCTLTWEVSGTDNGFSCEITNKSTGVQVGDLIDTSGVNSVQTDGLSATTRYLLSCATSDNQIEVSKEATCVVNPVINEF